MIIDSEMRPLGAFALNLAQIGGDVLKKYWGKVLEVRDKEIQGDLVTEVDKQSEFEILSLLNKHYPDHCVLAEESATNNFNKEYLQKADFLWVIDPLDGTINYSHSYPMVAVSIALLHKGKPIVGVVFNPILNELFLAVKGQGASLNGTPIDVSQNKELSKSLLASGFAYDRKLTNDNNYKEFSHLTHITLGVRRGGSAALDMAYVACGRFDGYWERGIKPWDIAAGWLLITEAGGLVSDYDTSPLDLFSGRVLATNAHLQSSLSRELLGIRATLET